MEDKKQGPWEKMKPRHLQLEQPLNIAQLPAELTQTSK